MQNVNAFITHFELLCITGYIHPLTHPARFHLQNFYAVLFSSSYTQCRFSYCIRDVCGVQCVAWDQTLGFMMDTWPLELLSQSLGGCITTNDDKSCILKHLQQFRLYMATRHCSTNRLVFFSWVGNSFFVWMASQL